MAARSTHITLENQARTEQARPERLNLRRTEMKLEHGVWTSKPPQLIGDRGEWESESSGILTGTEGRVPYQIETIDGQRVGEVRLHWNNPYVGSNSYHESVAPAAAEAGDTGFSVVHVGGRGENAAHHGLTATQYQQTFDQLTRQGFRPVAVSGYALVGLLQQLGAVTAPQPEGSVAS